MSDEFYRKSTIASMLFFYTCFVISTIQQVDKLDLGDIELPQSSAQQKSEFLLKPRLP